MTETVTACIIVIGNEILSGRTKDANIAFLGERLNDLGVRLMEARVVPDVPDTIIATVNECRERFDYVFTTGGIGPTHDDITSECVAQAFGLDFGRNPEAEAILVAHYRSEDLTEARLRMANTPVGATLLENPVSKAPGFQVENVYVLPGVPSIMQAIFSLFEHTLVGGQPMLSETISVNVPEGQMAKPLGEIQDVHPDVEIGSYPFFRMGKLGASLVIRGTDAGLVSAAAAAVRQAVHDLGGTATDETEPPKDD